MKVMVRSTKLRPFQRASRPTPSLKKQHQPLKSRPTITSNLPRSSSNSNNKRRNITLTIKQLLRNSSSSNNNRSIHLRHLQLKVEFLPISLLQLKRLKRLNKLSLRLLTV